MKKITKKMIAIICSIMCISSVYAYKNNIEPRAYMNEMIIYASCMGTDDGPMVDYEIVARFPSVSKLVSYEYVRYGFNGADDLYNGGNYQLLAYDKYNNVYTPYVDKGYEYVTTNYPSRKSCDYYINSSK